MPVIDQIAEFNDEKTFWRCDFLPHPETAFEKKDIVLCLD